MQLVSIHNSHFLIQTLRELRMAIIEGTAEDFSKQFFTNYFRDAEKGIPDWIKNALNYCEIKI